MVPPIQPLGFGGAHAPIREDEKEDESDPFMDTDQKKDMEFMMDWNFAQASADNSVDDRRPSQLEDAGPGGQQPPSSNNNRNTNRQHNQNSNDYMTQPHQQQSMQNQHMSSQNEDHSRYTELSSIRPDSVNEGQQMAAPNQYSSHP